MNSRASRRLVFDFALLVCAVLLPAARAGEPDAIVELPPMIISESTDKTPWRYARGSEIEVLGRCDPDLIADLVRRDHQLTHLVRALLPQELQFQMSVPKLVVLVDGASAPALSRDFLQRFGTPVADAAAASQATQAVDELLARHGGIVRAGRTAVRMIPNLRLQDVDGMAIFAIAEPKAFNAAAITYTPGHMLSLLANRTPALPAWYVAGWLRFYEACRFGDAIVMAGPLLWRSEPETKRLREDPDAARAVMPLVDFFRIKSVPADPQAAAAWRSQADLLVRWSMETPERRSALARFVAESATEGESDALAQRCLGLAYAAWRDQLSDALPVLVAMGNRIPVSAPPRLRRVDVSLATAADIGRLKGEWERLEVAYVRHRHAEFASPYLGLVQETLQRARSAAPSDPGVLAVAGLLACDLGDRTTALPLLEAAAAGARCRPRVYAELAALRMGNMQEEEMGSSADLSAAEAAIVIETLAPARQQQPPLAMTYAVMAAAWARSDLVPSTADLAVLDEALVRFPRHPQLLYYASIVYARHRSVAAGLALAERGEQLVITSTAKARFAELKRALSAGAAGAK